MGKYKKHTFYSKRNINMVKIRIMALLSLLLMFLCEKPPMLGDDIKEETWERMTSYMLPLLTYETENGKGNVAYDSKYEVPDWFYEDENAPVNNDLATTDTMSDLSDDKQDNTAQTIISGIHTFTREELAEPDFLLNHIFVVDNNTSMTAEELSLESLLDTDISVADVCCSSYEEAKEAPPKILIYHTHGSESFADSRPNEVEDSIIGVGTYLTDILEEKYYIPVYHDETAYDMVDGSLDRSKAYENAYANVTKILEENPSIEVVIDLHRDGVDEETHLVTDINNKPTAKIMFLNGVSRSNMNGEIAYLNNPNKKMNLAFSFQMYLQGKEQYGDYIRKIYVRSLRYNLHLMPRTTLIEVGAQNNTVEEEKNAMEPLADILYEVLRADGTD